MGRPRLAVSKCDGTGKSARPTIEVWSASRRGCDERKTDGNHPVQNEAENIQECINSALKIADEVLIADSGSTDQTLDIVRSLGPYRIIEREYVNSGDFRIGPSLRPRTPGS